MNNEQMQAKLKIIFAMVTFGTIGIFVRNIELPSTVIALARGIIGTLFLLMVVFGMGIIVATLPLRKILLFGIKSVITIERTMRK